jgi:hypothetical protein
VKKHLPSETKLEIKFVCGAEGCTKETDEVENKNIKDGSKASLNKLKYVRV